MLQMVFSKQISSFAHCTLGQIQTTKASPLKILILCTELEL